MSDVSNASSFDDYNTALNGLPSKLASSYNPSRYQARQAALQGAQPAPASFGAAGLAPLAGAIPAGIAAAPLAAAAAVPAGIAYGIGKLVAPKWTDEAVGKIKNFINTRIRPQVQNAQATGSAFMTGEGESLPGAGFVESKLPTKWQQTLEQIKSQNPTATMAGKIGGTIGQLAIPGATVFKGASTLGKVGAAAGNAALNALPYAAGAGLNAYANTGNVGQALKQAGTTEGTAGLLGGALGGLGGLISEKLPGILSGTKKAASDTFIREALDIDPKAFKNVASFGGKLKGAAAQDSAEALRNQLIQLGQDAGITDKASREAWVASQADKWKSVDQAWDASGKTVADFTDQIMQHPDIQNVISENPNGQQWVQSLIDNASKKNGIANVRDYLQRQIAKAHLPGATTDVAEQAAAAGGIKDVVDSAFVPPDLKADYAKYKVLNEAITHKDLRLNAAPFTVGSQTAGRMIGSGIAGGVMGATTGEGDTGKTIRNSLIGAVAGSLAPRLGVALANKGMGALAGKIAPMIPEMTARSGAPVANALSALGGRIAGMQANAATSPVASTPAASAASSGAPEQTVASIAHGEDALPAENQQAAKDQVNTAWSDQIKTRLGALYDSMIAPMYGSLMSKDQFFQTAQQMTNNWDPHLTAGFVFQDRNQALAYLKSYDTALKLQGMNLDQALSASGGVNPLTNPGTAAVANPIIGAVTGRAPQTEQSAMALENLKNVIVQHATPYGGKPDTALVNQVSKMVDGIAAMRVPTAKKKRILRDELQQYGIDYDQLSKYGVQDIVGSPPVPQQATT